MPKPIEVLGKNKLNITEGEFVSAFYKLFTGRKPTDEEKKKLLDILEECKEN